VIAVNEVPLINQLWNLSWVLFPVEL